jgi:hypothetical protein
LQIRAIGLQIHTIELEIKIKIMDIYDKAEDINNKNDFVDFLKILKNDLKDNNEDWDNNSLELFLEGLYGYCMDNKEERVTWKEFAKSLLAARVYE